MEKKMSQEEVQKSIREVCNEIADFLIEKNKSYGNSALEPVRILSKVESTEQIRVRIDDKLSRLACGTEYAGDDTIKDLVGYFVLLIVAQKMNEKHGK